MSTITMGNDEFILYIRKKKDKCNLTNDQLGRKIWEWILLNDTNAIEITKDEACLWGNNTQNTDPKKLPKTATQFSFDRTILPSLYSFLDSL